MSNEGVTSSTWTRELTCYKDSDLAEGVCGECGRPVCADHQRSFHDSTFHHYEGGSRRAVVALISLVGVPVVFDQLFPDLIPSLIVSVLRRPLFFTDAVVHSAVILGLALGLTLRFQSGEHRGNFRILARRVATRHLCGECYEETFLQRALHYALAVVAILLMLLGLRDLVSKGILLPLRTVAVGIGVWVLRDDLVAYAMYALEADEQTAERGPTADLDPDPDPDPGPDPDPQSTPPSPSSSTTSDSGSESGSTVPEADPSGDP